MKGILTIFLPMAQGLTIADSMSSSSDPYVEIVFPDGKKRTTKTIEKTLNPIWNYQDKYRIDFLKEDYNLLWNVNKIFRLEGKKEKANLQEKSLYK